MNRSRTAEKIFRAKYGKHQFLSAGLSEKYCTRNNSTRCTVEILNWADRIFVMEELHIQRIAQYVGSAYLEKVVNLEIPMSHLL